MNVALDKVAAESDVHYLEPNERKKERTANAGLFFCTSAEAAAAAALR